MQSSLDRDGRVILKKLANSSRFKDEFIYKLLVLLYSDSIYLEIFPLMLFIDKYSNYCREKLIEIIEEYYRKKGK